MRVRALDASRDMRFGRQQLDFYRDVPEAPAQCAMTRLQLYTGDWFLDRRRGTPWRTQVLGKYTADTRDPVIRARILGTQGVRSIMEYNSQLNRDTRAFDVQVEIDTIYGAAKVEATI